MAETEKGSRPPRTFALRLAAWYATLFVIGSIAIVVLTYFLTAVSLEQRDQQIVHEKLGEYAVAYERGGIAALTDIVRAEQSTAPERLFVRVLDRGSEMIVLSGPEGWRPEALEMASLRLGDGTRRHAVRARGIVRNVARRTIGLEVAKTLKRLLSR